MTPASLLVVARDLPAGHRLGAEDLVCKRPAHGISPAEIDQVLGKIAACDIDEDDLLTWEMLK